MTRQQCIEAALLLDKRFLTPCAAIQSPNGLGHAHLRWMVFKIVHGHVEGKAEAWLGYIQGVLVATDAATLDEMKMINRLAKQ